MAPAAKYSTLVRFSHPTSVKFSQGDKTSFNLINGEEGKMRIQQRLDMAK